MSKFMIGDLDCSEKMKYFTFECSKCGGTETSLNVKQSTYAIKVTATCNWCDQVEEIYHG